MGIPLPSPNWFVQVQGDHIIRNTYTGSCGTNPLTGCISERIFNYKVYVQGETSEELTLVAECYTRLPWVDNLEKVNYQRHITAFSPEGLQEVSEWLSQENQMAQ